MFTDQILHHAHDLITLALRLCVMENIEVRDTANEMLGSLIMQISNSLRADSDEHLRLFREIMGKFDQILDANDYRNV